MNEEKRYALLIDSDNISSKYIDVIFDELSNIGLITVRRIYGDWTRNVNGWNRDVMLKYSIVPIQQYAYTTGKNATDSAMIIDAMDLLYTGNIEGFCLVSSDSDFTRLATRLRESGKIVIGMGENKTPEAFVNSCTSFKMLDSLYKEENVAADDIHINEADFYAIETDDEKSENVNISSITDIKLIQKAIYDIIDANSDKGKKTHLGEIGSRLQNRYPDFDVRNYGYSKLTTFVSEAFENFELTSNGHQNYVNIKDEIVSKEVIREQITRILKSCKKNECNIGQLNKVLKQNNVSFSIKKYGYSKWSSFLKSFGCFKVNGSNVTIL